jgi:probable rRNA maturation factor
MPGASPRTGRARTTVEVRASATVASPVTAAAAERLARAVLRAEAVSAASISVALVGRRRIRSLNATHLGENRETDVIAFALLDARTHGRTVAGKAGARPPLATRRLATGLVVGDVYVCVPVAAAQARRFRTTARDEVRRLVVHGVLHVLGYDHPSDGGRTAGPMWRRQEGLLRRLGGVR